MTILRNTLALTGQQKQWGVDEARGDFHPIMDVTVEKDDDDDNNQNFKNFNCSNFFM